MISDNLPNKRVVIFDVTTAVNRSVKYQFGLG